MSLTEYTPAYPKSRLAQVIRAFERGVQEFFGIAPLPQQKMPLRIDASVSCDLIDPALIANRTIYVVDNGAGSLLDQTRKVAAAAQGVVRLNDLDTAVDLMLDRDGADMALIVNIDLTAELEMAVDELYELKHLFPEVPVLICSSNFARSNFSLQRRAIAEASLRLPCSSAALALAIEAAVHNSAA
jgi:hypothetical protein